MTIEFELTTDREAHEPPEERDAARDLVAMLVSRRATGQISHHAFGELPDLLLPGDLIVVNTSATLPAAVWLTGGLAVHFSTPLPDGDWLVELRVPDGTATAPFRGGSAGQRLDLPGGATLTLAARFTRRLWRARLSTAVVPYLLRQGRPIRYSYVDRAWPIESYQTVFAAQPGSAEMPSASRPFTPEIVTRLVTKGITIAPITLHTGVSSLEGHEDPYPEPFDVPPATARLVNLTRQHGGRVIAAGTTVVRALETAARPPTAGRAGPDPAATSPTVVQMTGASVTGASVTGASVTRASLTRASLTRASAAKSPGRGPAPRSWRGVTASAGWTEHIVTPKDPLRAVDGLLTGLHEPRSSHLRMLAAFAGPQLLSACYAAAIERGYLWHEFGDLHLLLP